MTGEDQVLVRCPDCEAEYKTHDTGDAEVCDECGARFNRFTNTIGRGDGEACYEAIYGFIADAREAGIEIDTVCIPTDYWEEVSELAEKDDDGFTAVSGVPLTHAKYQDAPEAVVEIDV